LNFNFQICSSDESPEYFDVYGKIETRYSQVYWNKLEPIPLSSSIVERFKGKVMAITGYEADQVQQTPDGDVSFPIYKAYNHHYFAWLNGADAEMVKLSKPSHRVPNPTMWHVRTKDGSNTEYPSSIVFKENPGGEYRYRIFNDGVKRGIALFPDLSSARNHYHGVSNLSIDTIYLIAQLHIY
jgi:hypothetical protein